MEDPSKDVTTEPPPESLAQRCKALAIKEQHIIYLSISVITTEILHYFSGSELAAFLVGCFTICYLAKFTGDTMEDLCDYIPSRIAALISAFLGNVPELITNVVALSKNLGYFILIALIGGSIANGLFLMGSCIGFSEYGFPKKPLQEKPAHIVNMIVFGITSALCCVPSIVQAATVEATEGKSTKWWLAAPTPETHGVNYAICVLLLLLYVWITYYQLVYESTEDDGDSAKVGCIVDDEGIVDGLIENSDKKQPPSSSTPPPAKIVEGGGGDMEPTIAVATSVNVSDDIEIARNGKSYIVICMCICI